MYCIHLLTAYQSVILHVSAPPLQNLPIASTETAAPGLLPTNKVAKSNVLMLLSGCDSGHV